MIGDPNNSLIIWSCGRYYDVSTYIMSASKTTDGGTTWTRYNFGIATGFAYTLAMDPTNSNVIYAGGTENSAPAVYKTTNSGTNWSKLAGTGLAGTVYALAIDPSNPNLIYAGTSSSLYKSTNAGNNWSTTGFPGGYTKTICIDVTSVKATIIYAGTYSNGVYQSTNNGSNWTQMNAGLDDRNINSLKVSSNQFLFAGTYGGSAYRWPLSTSVDELHADKIESPFMNILPNPSRGRATICYTLGRSLDVKLSVFDIQGRLVRTLVNEKRMKGQHTVMWNGCDEDGKALPNGIYFCSLVTGDTALIEKMVILK